MKDYDEKSQQSYLIILDQQQIHRSFQSFGCLLRVLSERESGEMDVLLQEYSILGPWKNIMRACSDLNALGMDVFKMIRCWVGSGSSVSFWIDNWTGFGPLKDRYPLLFLLESNKTCTVEQRMSPSPLSRFNWDWIGPALPSFVGPLLHECEHFLLAFECNSGSEFWGWDDGNGTRKDFAVKTVRMDVESIILGSSATVLPWSNWLPIKVNAFVWRAALDRIASKTNLSLRGITLDISCESCSGFPESVDHLLFRCPRVKTIWTLVLQWCKVPPDIPSSVSEVISMHNAWGSSIKFKRALHCILLTTMWIIWKTRNNKHFKNRIPRLDETIGDIKLWSFTWVKNRGKCSLIDWNSWCNFSFTM
ncbi:hypothetical protein SSX86_007647 [Deinandra increscens subsp. villosa]|uniref:Reverse transcriptase zinc-binding domain-containing protein n=1 Tax=Deinandra increscens subsp. villosa TaxID=3103831 RepID=A0AAP0DHW1_9ASTR